MSPLIVGVPSCLLGKKEKKNTNKDRCIRMKNKMQERERKEKDEFAFSGTIVDHTKLLLAAPPLCTAAAAICIVYRRTCNEI